MPLYVKTAIAVKAARVTRIGMTSDQEAEPNSKLNDVKLTKVSESATTMPAFCSPIKAMNSPTPAGIASRTDVGMASNIFFLRPVTVRMMNAIPSSRIRTSAFA